MSELKAERRLVKEALDELKVDAWVFETDAGARSESIEATFLEEVEEADLYLGIFWSGYGAYTRAEYDHALEHGKDRLVYEKKADTDSTRDAELETFLDELGRVETGVTPRRFESAEQLREFVKEDVARWQTDAIRKREPTWSRSSVVNLALTVASLVLALLYFGNHVSPLLPNQLVLGGVSLAVVASAAAWLVGKLFGKEVIGWVRRLLARPRTTPWLAGLCGALLLASLATSSVYLVPGEGLPSGLPASVRISVAGSESGTGDVLEVGSRPVGKRYFGRWRPARLDLELLEPPGYDVAKDLTLYPAWSLHHRVPADFKSKVMRVVRLAPFTQIWRGLRKIEAARPSDFGLRVLVNGQEALRIEDLRRQAVLIGAGVDDMVRAEERMTTAAVEEDVSTHAGWSDLDSAQQVGFVGAWRARPRYEGGLSLQADDEVIVVVRKKEEEVFRVTVPQDSRDLAVRIEQPIRTLLLGGGR